MDCITLTEFRASLYACFHAAGDTLLNIVDALATETAAKSLPELSLSAFFPRQWSSIYQGLQHARIDRAALRRLFAASAPCPHLDSNNLFCRVVWRGDDAMDFAVFGWQNAPV